MQWSKFCQFQEFNIRKNDMSSTSGIGKKPVPWQTGKNHAAQASE
jgi:hypothetical protein